MMYVGNVLGVPGMYTSSFTTLNPLCFHPQQAATMHAHTNSNHNHNSSRWKARQAKNKKKMLTVCRRIADCAPRWCQVSLECLVFLPLAELRPNNWIQCDRKSVVSGKVFSVRL